MIPLPFVALLIEIVTSPFESNPLPLSCIPFSQVELNLSMVKKFTTNSITALPPNILPIKHQFNVIGLSILLLFKSYLAIFSFKVPKVQIVEQIVAIGFNTLPMVILMTGFSGMILSLETADWLSKYGARDIIGSLLCYSSINEIAPVFVSLAIGAQAGTAITAELAHMQITEQISAMRLSKVSPINYLVSSRLLAMIYSLPLAIIIGTLFSISGGIFVANIQGNIEYPVLADSIWRTLKIKDIIFALIKSFVLANYLIIIHTSFGLGTRGGAKEVGTMTSLSTIWATIGIICIDAILGYLMYVN